jgi:hypothetical protein
VTKCLSQKLVRVFWAQRVAVMRLIDIFAVPFGQLQYQGSWLER